ncbi:MAG: hypothetical protein IJ702_05550, partial [Fretibacterium sp.]|nr:hypothetical protein [Fretibacterium sp.]
GGGGASRWVVLKTMRGLEMGLLGGQLSAEQEEKYRTARLGDGEQSRGPEPMLQEVELVKDAGVEDIETWYQCRSDEEQVLVRAREILLDHRLPMKLVDVEYLLDRKKLFFYFTSEQRVDFRAYVRDLAREFRTRIEMRQIGVRDEARVVEGISPCGRPCCCSYWLHQFTPICIRMVKEQKLALNPTKISGICGRLMCCMAYEHPVYGELWKTLPGPGAKIRTEQGTYVLEGVDLATEHVQVRFPSGRVVPVSIAEFPDFRDAVLRGEDWGDEPTSGAAAGRGAGRPRLERQGADRQERPSARKPEARGPLQEKITLEEHLARRERQAGEERPPRRRGRPGQTGPSRFEDERPRRAAPPRRETRKGQGPLPGEAQIEGGRPSPRRRYDDNRRRKGPGRSLGRGGV